MDTDTVRLMANSLKVRGATVQELTDNAVRATMLELGAAILDELRKNAENRKAALANWTK